MDKQTAIKRFRSACNDGLQIKYPNTFLISDYEVADAEGRMRLQGTGLLKVFDYVDLSTESAKEPFVFVLSKVEYKELVNLFCETEKKEQIAIEYKSKKRKELLISLSISLVVSAIWFLIFWFLLMPMPTIDGTHVGIGTGIWASALFFFGAFAICKIAFSDGEGGFYSGDTGGFPYGAF